MILRRPDILAPWLVVPPAAGPRAGGRVSGSAGGGDGGQRGGGGEEEEEEAIKEEAAAAAAAAADQERATSAAAIRSRPWPTVAGPLVKKKSAKQKRPPSLPLPAKPAARPLELTAANLALHEKQHPQSAGPVCILCV